MRILIVGSDANAYLIAEKISKNPNVDLIFMTSGSSICRDYIQKIDISEFDNEELLDFAIANEISLTIVTSFDAINNDIAGFFNAARQPIFAPDAEAAYPTIYKSNAKKLMYRLKIPTMKFGVFERENQAIDYITDNRRPLVIKNDTFISGEYPQLAYSFRSAKTAVEHCFTFPDNKVVIEDYIEAKEVSLYFITDGYTALYFGSCSSEESLNFEKGIFSPDKYLSEELTDRILKEVIYPVIDEMSTRSTAYCGILGVDIIVQDDIYNVIEFNPFFKSFHLQSILPIINSDVTDLFLSAACGSLSDEYTYVEFSKEVTYSKLVSENFVQNIQDKEFENFYINSFDSNKYVLTQLANTYGRAKINFENNIEILKDCEAENE